MPKLAIIPSERVVRSIIVLRGRRVILDADLARLYGVETGALNRAVKRNAERFPELFVFRLTAKEVSALRCQIGISNGGRGGRRYLPHAFTEYGALMAANVLNSPRAVKMSVFVVEAFVELRKDILNYRALAESLVELEGRLTGRLDKHEKGILQLIDRLKQWEFSPESRRRRIGFLRERRAAYRFLRKGAVHA